MRFNYTYRYATDFEGLFSTNHKIVNCSCPFSTADVFTKVNRYVAWIRENIRGSIEETTSTQKPHEIVYTVRRGDNLTKIAREYSSTVQRIVQLNGIQNPDLIYPGQRLSIPVKQQAYSDFAEVILESSEETTENSEY